MKKRLLIEMLVGGVTSFLLWSFFGPNIIGWWYEPPSKDAFSCATTVRGALGQFVQMQLIMAAGGAVLLGLLMFLGRRWLNKRNGGTPEVQATNPATPQG